MAPVDRSGEQRNGGLIDGKPWCMDDALQRLALGPEKTERIILNFTQMYADHAALVRQLVESRQYAEASELLHKIRGTASAIAADRLAEAARTLEEKIGSLDAEHSAVELATFENVLLGTLQVMRKRS
jgi:HPt (histidine-containing phosphotransfer) domain-containing protein